MSRPRSSRSSRSAVGTTCSITLFAALGCSAPGGPEGATPWTTQSTGSQNTDGGVVPDSSTAQLSGTCTPPHASESLTPRVTAMGMAPMTVSGGGSSQVIKTSDLFDKLNTSCGSCHVASANGGKQTSAATFTTTVDSTWVAAITSDDPSKAMPPENKAYSSRPANDPIRTLVSLLQAWIAAGRPSELFTVDDPSTASPDNSQTVADYSFTADMAAAMSNLGTCIPDKAAYASSTSNEMYSKDTFFGSATELPTSLGDTDLVTFDSSVLAANGVVAYVPTYPLWSNGSGKLRHIRVPKGTSVKFDKATQTFDIPPNTRFYKTFFRKVKDIAGRESHRKIETRLIVARPDSVAADGSIQQNALFGTYLWNDDETEATLNTATYRDLTPFPDKLFTYATDELLYEEVLASQPPGSKDGYEDRLADDLYDHYRDLVQHYAVPGRIRCVQCHQGSPTKDFVLGFFPLQVARQPDGQAGTYEPTGADELTQLQRMIDYGLVTGMDSPADVVGLEQSQAPRHARTHEELAAQAYMVGNCAHCHNPRGYPSILKPELAPVLNFMPGAGQDGGGVFEFPLTTMSPIRQRGADRDVQMPYITPSLRDYPVVNQDTVRLDSGVTLDPGFGPEHDKSYAPKYDTQSGVETSGYAVTKLADGTIVKQATTAPRGCAVTESPELWCGDRLTGHTFIDAPWRSLIYRNVDAPFPYYDDYVPFPHMPMNTAGYDERAPRLMGDWMVSIPAVRADPLANAPGHGEDDLPSLDAKAHDGSYDDLPQPYVEVKPGDGGYAQAVADAKARLAVYHAGLRYNYRQEVLGTDILDELPDISNNRIAPGTMYLPDPTRYAYSGNPPRDPVSGKDAFPAIGVPYHSHWFNYDPTDNSENWQPRRGTAWQAVLVDGVPDTSRPLSIQDKDWVPGNGAYDAEMARRVQTTMTLATTELTDDLRQFATTPRPFGLWKVKPECQAKLASTPTVSDFSGPDGPWWITRQSSAPPRDASVYMAAPGQMAYRHICFNCHGPHADGRGIQADALAAASDGDARPANFVAGLFGPVDSPGSNLLRVFGGDQGKPDTSDPVKAAESLASRYMAWMALGGTLQNIPRDIIQQIEATRILGVQRPHLQTLEDAGGGASANMLDVAKGLCAFVLPSALPQKTDTSFDIGGNPKNSYPPFDLDTLPFIHSNGDQEMWIRICSQFNRPVVRVYALLPDTKVIDLGNPDSQRSMLYGESYPKDAPVWDHNRTVQIGINLATNLYPACLDDRVKDDDPEKDEKNAVIAQFQSKQTMPVCPTDFLTNAQAVTKAEGAMWAIRGGIAAGMAVFSYLRDPNTDLANKSPAPYYDECQLLP